MARTKEGHEERTVDEKVDTARPVESRTERSTSADPYAGIHAARERFGGIDIPASLVGMLTALSTVLILAGLVGAAFGVVGYQTGLEENAEDLSIGSLIGGVAILFVAYLIGGWAAGRMARYDGAKNGFATGVWTLIFGAILAALGAWAGAEYDVFQNVELPQWFDRDALTLAALASGIGAIAAMFVGGVIGGIWGARYHRRADATIVDTRTESVRTDERIETDRTRDDDVRGATQVEDDDRVTTTRTRDDEIDDRRIDDRVETDRTREDDVRGATRVEDDDRVTTTSTRDDGTDERRV